VQLSSCDPGAIVWSMEKSKQHKCTKIMEERPRGKFRKRATTLIHDEHFLGLRQNSAQVRDFDLRDTACGEGSIRRERYLEWYYGVSQMSSRQTPKGQRNKRQQCLTVILASVHKPSPRCEIRESSSADVSRS